MTTTLENDILEIDDEKANAAKVLASTLSNPSARKRALIDMLGINCAIDYLRSKKIRINTQKSVYKIPLLFEEFKITDIYCGNYRIDVITLYKEKNIKIPKIHVEMDILPHFYFVVQIGAKIKEVKPIGFIEAKNIIACTHDSKFYYPTLNMLVDINRFRELIRHSTPAKTTLGKHIDCLEMFLKFMDNDLSSVYKRQLIQHLMNCDSCRSRFIDAVEFEKLANNIRFYPELLRKTEKNIQNPLEEKDEKIPFSSLEESLEHAELENSDFIDVEDNQTDKNKEGIIQEKPKTVQMFDLIDKDDKKLLNKKVIDSIFSEMPKFEFPTIKSVITAKNRRTMIVCVVSFLILASFALISLKGTESAQEINDMAAVEEYNSQSMDDYNEDGYYLNSSTQALPNLANIENESMRQPISTKPTYSPTISKIAFEAPGNIVNNNSYTKFLQLLGKTIKLNLQNDLLLVDDVPVNKMAKADIEIMANGTVKNVKITYSSGSKTVDDTMLKVLKETLSYMKPPSFGIASKKPAVVTLVLNLN